MTVVVQEPELINKLRTTNNVYVGRNTYLTPIYDDSIRCVACRDDTLLNLMESKTHYVGYTATSKDHAKRIQEYITAAEKKWSIPDNKKWIIKCPKPNYEDIHYFVMETHGWDVSPMRLSFLTLLMRIATYNSASLEDSLKLIEYYNPSDGGDAIYIRDNLRVMLNESTLKVLDEYPLQAYQRDINELRFCGFTTSTFDVKRGVFINDKMERYVKDESVGVGRMCPCGCGMMA